MQENSDIVLRFGAKDHFQCASPFDGPSGVLGHAFFPPSGVVHFDDDEQWTSNSGKGSGIKS